MIAGLTKREGKRILKRWFTQQNIRWSVEKFRAEIRTSKIPSKVVGVTLFLYIPMTVGAICKRFIDCSFVVFE